MGDVYDSQEALDTDRETLRSVSDLQFSTTGDRNTYELVVKYRCAKVATN